MQAVMSSGVAMLHFRHQESLLPKRQTDLYLCVVMCRVGHQRVGGHAGCHLWVSRSAPVDAQALVLSKHRAHGRLSALEKADDCD